MLNFFRRNPKKEFQTALKASLPGGVDLAPELWVLIEWLENKGQTFRYRSSQELFVPTTPVKDMASLWSHLAFTIEPDLVGHWFGKPGFETQLIPLVRCGGDGSYFALWRLVNGQEKYVFLGSEGLAFVVADTPTAFICLITMGYVSIEDRGILEETPEKNWSEWNEDVWPTPTGIRNWVSERFSISYPPTGIELAPHFEASDPFDDFIAKAIE